MLVLTRKEQQQIRIGQNILVTIVRLKGNTVRIGIEAPQSVRVTRPETETPEAAPASVGEGVEAAVVATPDAPLASPARRDPPQFAAAERARPLAGRVRPRTAGAPSGMSVRPPQRLSPAGLRAVLGRR